MADDGSVIGTVTLSCGSVISVGDGIGSSVVAATDVGSEVTISVGLEDGISVMLASDSVVDGKGTEVISSEVDGSLETSGVLPGGDMVGEASDVETGGCVLTSELDSVETTVDISSEGVVKEGNTVGSGVVVSDGVIELSGMKEITVVPRFVSDADKELSGMEGKTVGSKVCSMKVTELSGVEGSTVSILGSGATELSGTVVTGS